ncbi:MAG: energy-coupling factor ABC transporter permease [Gammaproteobacteria bacterium]
MSVNPQFFNSFWIMIGALVYGLVLLKAVHAAQWWRLKNPRDFNVLLNTSVCMFFFWLMNTDFQDSQLLVGPGLHLLGATLMAMMFGWAFAILAMSMVLIAFTFMTASPVIDHLFTLPWNALTTIVLPVLLSYQLFRLVDTRLPNNFFIYIFVCAFFGAALSVVSVILATTGIHYLSGAYSLDKLTYSYVPYGLILMFPEAFLTGMMMSIFVVYRPQWVSTFDDYRYLRKR